jgi:hypothetical protein
MKRWLLLLLMCSALHAQTPVNGDACYGQQNMCGLKLQATAGNTAVFFVASDVGSGNTLTVGDSTHDTVISCGAGVFSATFYGGGNGGILKAYLISFATSGPEWITATAYSTVQPPVNEGEDVVGIAEQYSGNLYCDKSAGGWGSYTTTGLQCESCTAMQFMPVGTAKTLATTQANELLVGAFFTWAIKLPVVGAGFAARQQENILNGFLGVLEDMSVSATGTYAATANVPNNQQWMGLIITLHS